MSTCAVLLVKDEVDMIGPCLRHLLWNVDEILLRDNGSTDGSTEIMEQFSREYANVQYEFDPDPAHYQSRKMTALAFQAFQRGHRWVLPVDPDELWYAPEGRSISEWLAVTGGEQQFVKASIYNHVCTSADIADEPNPVKRIGYRKRWPLDIRWGKVACRCRPDLTIHNGNHSADTMGTGTCGFGLDIRHFPYRSAEQFVKKALSCYHGLQAAVDEDKGVGAHCRAYGQAVEEGGVEAGHAWFYDAFYASPPESDDSIFFDPAVIR